jgi:hypothetical protein
MSLSRVVGIPPEPGNDVLGRPDQNRLTLRFEPQPRAALAVGRDPEIGDPPR